MLKEAEQKSEFKLNFASVTFLPEDYIYADSTGIVLSPELIHFDEEIEEDDVCKLTYRHPNQGEKPTITVNNCNLIYMFMYIEIVYTCRYWWT